MQALFRHGGIADFAAGEAGRAKNSKKRILVGGASGGVGVWLLQLAREAGVGGIVAVCGSANVEFVRELGATEVVDYSREKLGEWRGEKVDLVVDCKGGKSLEEAWGCVKEGGKVVSICEVPKKREGVESMFFVVEPRGDDLRDVGRLVEEGKVRVIVDGVWRLEEFEEAIERVEGGKARGKVILKL